MHSYFETFKNNKYLTPHFSFLQIQPEVEVTVENGGVEVSGLMILLVQEVIYTCNMGEDDERMKKEVQKLLCLSHILSPSDLVTAKGYKEKERSKNYILKFIKL